MSRLHRTGSALARSLATAGVIEEPRLRPTLDPVWPRIRTGFTIRSERVDLSLVRIGLGVGAVGVLAK